MINIYTVSDISNDTTDIIEGLIELTKQAMETPANTEDIYNLFRSTLVGINILKETQSIKDPKVNSLIRYVRTLSNAIEECINELPDSQIIFSKYGVAKINETD